MFPHYPQGSNRIPWAGKKAVSLPGFREMRGTRGREREPREIWSVGRTHPPIAVLEAEEGGHGLRSTGRASRSWEQPLASSQQLPGNGFAQQPEWPWKEILWSLPKGRRPGWYFDTDGVKPKLHCACTSDLQNREIIDGLIVYLQQT